MATVPSSGQHGPSLTTINFSFYIKEVACCSKGSSAVPFKCVCVCARSHALISSPSMSSVCEGCGDTHLCDKISQQVVPEPWLGKSKVTTIVLKAVRRPGECLVCLDA